MVGFHFSEIATNIPKTPLALYKNQLYNKITRNSANLNYKTESIMKPEKIIFDNDIGTDCDDAGALLLLHRLCDLGEAELVAITHCFATPHVAGCLDAICRHEGRRVPIGINYESEPPEGDTYAEKICKEFENGYPPEDFYNKKIPDTLSVLI